ncbi:uncharacterized protein LOC105891007 [Clupea harengus]|uniref:Uncharacterized protein LOC105891007 n=1 Tax=Clupea harengus TaxID=7950 RepID=A0A6P3VHW1_CLUHA|nr:uncharacterized protein LOC105891007 [Clupea harengus]
MDLKAVLIWTCALISQVRSLMCNNCFSDAGGTCHDVQGPCPDACASVRIATYVGEWRKGVMNMKTCSTADICVMGSLNFGTKRVKVESTCCTTDLCNDQPPPEYLKDISNGKRCFTCKGGDCNLTVECLGNEDRCVTSTSTEADQRPPRTQKGCVSASICQQRDSSHFLASMADSLDCCEGDLCNGVQGTNQNAGNMGHVTKSNTQNLLLLLLMCLASSDLVS